MSIALPKIIKYLAGKHVNPHHPHEEAGEGQHRRPNLKSGPQVQSREVLIILSEEVDDDSHGYMSRERRSKGGGRDEADMKLPMIYPWSKIQ